MLEEYREFNNQDLYEKYGTEQPNRVSSQNRVDGQLGVASQFGSSQQQPVISAMTNAK